jgi:thioredoxin 1
MAGAATIQFTESNFQSEAIQAGVPVLVDFWAAWCNPCKALGPTIDELATEFQGKAKVGKVDVDSNHQLALQFDIQSIPTVLLMKNGQILKRWVGVQSKNVLADAINSAM